MSMEITRKYERREKKYGTFLGKVNNRIKKVVFYKLLVVFAGLGLSISFFAFRYYYLGFGALITVFILYFFLIYAKNEFITIKLMLYAIYLVNISGNRIICLVLLLLL